MGTSTWSLQPALVAQAKANQSMRVIVLADRQAPQLDQGLQPLSAPARRDDVLQDLVHRLRHVLHSPGRRNPPGLLPMAAIADRAPLAMDEGEEDSTVLLRNFGGVMASVDAQGLDRVIGTAGVRRVIAIPDMRPLVAPLNYRPVAPADIREGPAAGLRQARVLPWWDQGLTGQGMRIAHFDTGLNAAHPVFDELRGRRRLRYAAFDRDSKIIPRARPRDQVVGPIVFHGTHTAGTLVGGSVDGAQIGVAPDASLISVQVFPNPKPRDADQHAEVVMTALDWILGERPHVLNLSFGRDGYDDRYLGVINEIVEEAGVPVIAAIGNDGEGRWTSPANLGPVIAVGAVDGKNRIASFSGNGSRARRSAPWLCAPGVQVLSAGRGSDLVEADGTSMAAPHVAGLVALARQKRESLTPRQIRRLLAETAHKPASWDSSRGGAGVIDGQALLAVL